MRPIGGDVRPGPAEAEKLSIWKSPIFKTITDTGFSSWTMCQPGCDYRHTIPPLFITRPEKKGHTGLL